MSIKPGPVTAVIGGTSVLIENIVQSYDVEFFDRVEFDHEKLRSAPLSTGVVSQTGTLLGGMPYEVVIDCALAGMAGGASSYVPRPLTPNSYPADIDNIKQRFNITRYQINGGQSPESASPGASVDALLAFRTASRHLLGQFQARIAAFGGIIAYEDLLDAQSDNFTSLYLTSGIAFTVTALGISLTNTLVTDFSITGEFAIPNAGGSHDIYKGFTAVIEKRTIVAASSS